MNKHLETIDNAIANVHSRWQDPYPYSLKEYELDLQNLIELRSFVEKQLSLNLYVMDLGWEGARVTIASSYESAVETIHAENIREYAQAAEQSPKSHYTAGLANLLTKTYPYDYNPVLMGIYPAVDGAFIQTDGE